MKFPFLPIPKKALPLLSKRETVLRQIRQLDRDIDLYRAKNGLHPLHPQHSTLNLPQ